MQEKYDVIVVGASIAGLTLSLLLTRQGHRVALLDRDKGVRPMVRPEILQPRFLDIFNELGLLSDVLQRPHQRCEIFNFRKITGPRLCRVDYGILNHPFPYTIITLPHVPQEVLRKRLEGCIHPMTRVVDTVRTDHRVSGVVVEREGKKNEYTAAVVVGADGRDSRIRALLEMPYQLYWYKDGYLSFTLRRIKTASSEVNYYMGRHQILGLFPISGETLCGLYLVSGGFMKNLRDQDVGAFKSALAAIDPGLPIAEITSWDQVSTAPCARVRVDHWVTDGACLVGDAAHAIHPHVAQGSTQALEDARVLANVIQDAFKKGDFSKKSLLPYEAARKGPVTRLQRLADEYVWLWDTGNPILAYLRDRAFTHVGQDKHLLYKTIANEAGLQAEPLTLWERVQAVVGI